MTWLRSTVWAAGIDPRALKASVELTEYGERMSLDQCLRAG